MRTTHSFFLQSRTTTTTGALTLHYSVTLRPSYPSIPVLSASIVYTMPVQSTIEIKTDKKIMCVAFKPDGVLVGADSYGAVRQWRVEDGVESNPSVIESDLHVRISVAIVSADGQWIVTSGLGRSVIVWSASTHQQILEITDHDTHTFALDVSSDSKLFASGSHDKTVRIFNITSGARIIPPLYHHGRVICVRFSPDSSKIATAAAHSNSFVGVYHTRSGDKLLEIRVGVTWPLTTPLAWSTDGQQLFAASLGKITSLDLITSSCSEWAIHDDNDKKVSIVVSDKIIACSAGLSVSFWDSSTHEEITRVNHTAHVACIAISRDGRYLACGLASNTGFGIAIHTLQELLLQRSLRALDVSSVSRLPLFGMSETVLKYMMVGNPIATESVLSDEIAESSDPSHETLATRALVRAHLGEWKTAIEDAEMSLRVKRSPIGQIAKSMGLAVGGQEEAALEEFDLVFQSCDPNDNELLLVIKSILVFVCNKRKEAISRLCGLIDNVVDETTKSHYLQVLGNMYLKQRDYEDAVRTLGLVKAPFNPDERGPLMTIRIIFSWNFQNLESIARERLCETLYASGSIKELGVTLIELVSHLAEDEREHIYGQILQDIITRSREVTLLAWTGKSSTCNSCLPSTPIVYGQTRFTFVSPEADELEKRTAELQTIFPIPDALMTYGWITRSQPVRFTHFRLLLPCIIFRTKRLQRAQGNVYLAETTVLGDVEFTTTDSLPLKEARRLVFVNPWIHLIRKACGRPPVTWKEGSESDVESITDADSNAGADAELVCTPMIEEVPTTPPDTVTDMYTQALRLVACLGQPFGALLLLKQPNGTYKRVAADHEFVIRGIRNNVPRDIRVEVLEIV